jgi:hypothetical protein
MCGFSTFSGNADLEIPWIRFRFISTTQFVRFQLLLWFHNLITHIDAISRTNVEETGQAGL